MRDWALKNRGGWVVASVALFTPSLIALILSGLAFSDPVIPDIISAPKQSDAVAEQFISLSQIMITMSVGIAAATIWVYKRPLKPRHGHLAALLLSVGMTLAFVSFYSGLRFIYDAAQQIRFMPFNFEPLRSRIYWQGMALLFQVSVLSFNTVVHYCYRDARFRGVVDA